MQSLPDSHMRSASSERKFLSSNFLIAREESKGGNFVFDHPDPKKPTYVVNTSHEDFVPAYVSPNDQKLSSEQMGKLKQKIPALAKKPSAQENRQKSEALRNEFHEQAKKLIDDMIKTCQEDH